MEGKPVIVCDRLDASGIRFWSLLSSLLREWCGEGEFAVVAELSEIVPKVMEIMGKR